MCNAIPLDRSTSTYIYINVSQDGTLWMNAHPHDVDFDLNDIFEISVGPRDMYDGIKSCLTYNPPGGSTPGYQRYRGVSAFKVPLCRDM